MRSRWALAAVWLLWPWTAYAAEPAAPAGHGFVLLKMLFVLGGVCLLAFASLKWGLKRFVAPESSANGAMRVVGRLPVEPRRSVLVVKVGERHLVLGSSEAGIQPLGELTAEEAQALAPADPRESAFARVHAAVAQRNVSRETPTEVEA